MQVHEVRPFGWRLDQDSPYWRKPTRPENMQDNAFRNQFDYTTVFYDVFRSVDPNYVVCVCPPFFNLKTALAKTKFFTAPAVNHEQVTPCEPIFIEHNKVAEIWLKIPEGEADILVVDSPMGHKCIPIGENMCYALAGKNVLLTKQKNNKISWICDWINMHGAFNDINAVLIFDNCSTEYSINDMIQEVSCNVFGIDTFVLAHWPYPFGPVGGVSRRRLTELVGKEMPWDSDFTNYAIPQAAIWRYLARASHVLWCDVDELVLSDDDKPLFDKVDQSKSGCIFFFGGQLSRVSSCDGHTISKNEFGTSDFFDYPIQVQEQEYGAKWALAPQRIKPGYQLKVHGVINDVGVNISECVKTVRLRHFTRLSTGWKIPERTEHEDTFDHVNHYLDCALIKCLERYFAGNVNLTYYIKKVLEFANKIGACPRKNNCSSVPQYTAYDCSSCHLRKIIEK